VKLNIKVPKNSKRDSKIL